MNKHLKNIITIAFICFALWEIQERFHLFDIKITNEVQQEQNKGNSNNEVEKQEKNEDRKFVEIFNSKGVVISVDVQTAVTEAERASGLSFRTNLGTYEGMLFVFPEDTTTSFWMKDMNMPLDIIFVDSSGFVVDIKENNEPCNKSYCPSITSSQKYRYVLEVNADFCKNNDIVVGNSVIMNNIQSS
ncbi:MAG: DUF192 domain-containing protein [Candidatus Dojkabacteria bacterium]